MIICTILLYLFVVFKYVIYIYMFIGNRIIKIKNKILRKILNNNKNKYIYKKLLIKIMRDRNINNLINRLINKIIWVWQIHHITIKIYLTNLNKNLLNSVLSNQQISVNIVKNPKKSVKNIVKYAIDVIQHSIIIVQSLIHAFINKIAHYFYFF